MVTTGESSTTQVALLHRISSIVSSDQDIESILQEMVSLTMNVTHSDACLVYLIDHATNEIVLRASQLPHDSEIGNVRMKIGEGITGWVAAHNAVVALPKNAAADARFKAFSSLQEDTYQAFLSVPLVDSGVIIGVINVHHRDPHQHASDEVALVTFIGEQMGGLIARARLTEQTQSAVRRMETLAAVAQAISAESYLERILQAISEMLAETMDSAVCSILLVDDEKKELTVSAARCSAPDYMHRMPIRMEGSLIEYVIRQGHPIVIPNIHAETRYVYPELSCKSEFTSLLAVPMTSKGEPVGAITFYTRAPHVFSREEVVFATVAAGLAAIAIRNVRLLARARDRKHRLETRRKIERAKSIIQYKCQLTEQQAYLRLRDESRKLRRTMREVAEAVILADGLNRG